MGLDVAGDPSDAGKMPEHMWVKEIEEILGERCCEPHQMSKKKRKNGPGKTYWQEYCVRGHFLEDDGDAEDDEEDDVPEPNTFWVEQGVLLDTIDVEDVKEALRARHEAVLDGLDCCSESACGYSRLAIFTLFSPALGPVTASQRNVKSQFTERGTPP